jgi:hypothetical protein
MENLEKQAREAFKDDGSSEEDGTSKVLKTYIN